MSYGHLSTINRECQNLIIEHRNSQYTNELLYKPTNSECFSGEMYSVAESTTDFESTILGSASKFPEKDISFRLYNLNLDKIPSACDTSSTKNEIEKREETTRASSPPSNSSIFLTSLENFLSENQLESSV